MTHTTSPKIISQILVIGEAESKDTYKWIPLLKVVMAQEENVWLLNQVQIIRCVKLWGAGEVLTDTFFMLFYVVM